MQRSPARGAFTLIEMIVVMSIILILVGLVIVLAPTVRIRQERARALSEIMNLVGACEVYKTDTGGYPQDNPGSAGGASVTNDLDPRAHFNPSSTASPTYAASGLFLYKQLTGDDNLNGQIDATETAKKYALDSFKPSRFDAGFKTSGTISYIMDPFGYSYGYSTAGLKAEQDYRVQLQTDPNAPRPSPSRGYNPTFDLWSTGGSAAATSADQPKWVKNW
jgi:prepilin-type N-terminal cleavage/methylation domain-containing protein